jgi:hypothetical protein
MNTEKRKCSFLNRRAGKQFQQNDHWNEDQRHYLVGRDWQNRRFALDAVTVSHSRTGAWHRDSIRGTLIFRDPVACHKPKTSLHPLNLHPHLSFDDRYPALILEPQTHQLHMCMSHGTSVSKAQNMCELSGVWICHTARNRDMPLKTAGK